MTRNVSLLVCGMARGMSSFLGLIRIILDLVARGKGLRTILWLLLFHCRRKDSKRRKNDEIVRIKRKGKNIQVIVTVNKEGEIKRKHKGG